MTRILGSVLALVLTSCGSFPGSGQVPTPPMDTCWFLEGQPIGRQGYTTLGELGMGGGDGQWADVRVYAWITANEVDLWGGAEMTRAVCTLTEDPDFIAATGESVGWNEFPLVNGMADWNDDRP